MTTARDVAEQIDIIAGLLTGQTSSDDAYDGPLPEEPPPDHLLDRHRADVDERYSDRAWGAA